jgi:hypothetical protein
MRATRFLYFSYDATKGFPITIPMFSIPIAFQKHVNSILVFFLFLHFENPVFQSRPEEGGRHIGHFQEV